MENQPILRRTLLTVAIMVGAWVAFLGTLSIVAVVVTSHIAGTSREEVTEESEPGKRLPSSALQRAPNQAGPRVGREGTQGSSSPNHESRRHDGI